MISSTRNIEARTEYAKTLFSEMGYGNAEKAHSVLFDAWLAELGTRLGAPEGLLWKNSEKDLAPLPETLAMIEGEKAMYGSDNATGAGAQLALECQAYTMLRKMYGHCSSCCNKIHRLCTSRSRSSFGALNTSFDRQMMSFAISTSSASSALRAS